MHLQRCKDQHPETLEAFYEELAQYEGYGGQEVAKAMLGLVARLRALPDERRVFGLTSHARLGFHAEDSSTSSAFVVVSALDARNYFVDYLMPQAIAPRRGAWVRGECRSEDEAVRMIEVAMERCEGWR